MPFSSIPSFKPTIVAVYPTFFYGSVPAHSQLLSFAFTRHPFNRLVSGYYQKFDKDDWSLPELQDLELKWMRDLIIKRYRRVDPTVDTTKPTPLELATYLIEESEDRGSEHLEGHFRPQWANCPWCLFDFDVIGRIETFDSDVAVIVDFLNLTVS